ncbi:MAG TPA: class I SAM-dependent methyltransferase [Longimicrobiales bacterium]
MASSKQLRLPEPGHLPRTGPVDAIDGYFKPGLGGVFRRRLGWTVDALPAEPVENMLEIGYGSGVFQYELSRHAHLSVGVDIHAYGGAVARQLAVDGVRALLVRADGSALPFRSDAFDVVVIASTLEFIPDPRLCLRESRRVLRPAGRLILVRPRRNRWADAVYRQLAGFDPEAEFRGGRERVEAALRDLPEARRATRPRWLPRRLAPYEVVTYRRRG